MNSKIIPPNFSAPSAIPPSHGADLEAASQRYQIPLAQWLDLSAAINPHAYPIAISATENYRQLPYSQRALQEAAQQYCAAPMLPVLAAGSQVLIQWLPLVHQQLAHGRRVAVPKIGYAEHEFRWRWAGYDIIYYDAHAPETIDELLQRDAIDVLIVISPHNPFAHAVDSQQLLAWHAALQRRHGWLIVDEAFIDATPQQSVSRATNLPGLIVLRSLGKFFGLAGLRCGYAFCCDEITRALAIAIGPWSLSTFTLQAAQSALQDSAWQQTMREQLAQWSEKNKNLLQGAQWARNARIYSHALFNAIELPTTTAEIIEDHCARHAIRVRRVALDNDFALLRFGLVDPVDCNNWSRLESVLQSASAN